jgi:flagellar biosynthesis/type III secretory pathway chaperone
MDELFKLLESFLGHLKTQMELFAELLPILDEEEQMMSIFDVGKFEKIVVRKDQLVQQASRVEEKRVICLRRICFLVGFDARGQALPSLREFSNVLLSYERNVENLLPAENVTYLKSLCDSIRNLSQSYLDSFTEAAPRIRRNQTVLTRLAKNFEQSLNLLKTEQNSGDGYNALGKSKNLFERPDGMSSVRITV